MSDPSAVEEFAQRHRVPRGWVDDLIALDLAEVVWDFTMTNTSGVPWNTSDGAISTARVERRMVVKLRGGRTAAEAFATIRAMRGVFALADRPGPGDPF